MLSGKLLRQGAGYGILSQAHLNSSSQDACAEAADTRPGCAGALTQWALLTLLYSYFEGGKPTRVLLLPQLWYNSVNF